MKLARRPGKWTLQIAVICNPQNVERLLTSAGGSDRLYLLPATLQGASCFRVCWGVYADSKQAATALDLPASLKPSSGRPAPVAIEKVIS